MAALAEDRSQGQRLTIACWHAAGLWLHREYLMPMHCMACWYFIVPGRVSFTQHIDSIAQLLS